MYAYSSTLLVQASSTYTGNELQIPFQSGAISEIILALLNLFGQTLLKPLLEFMITNRKKMTFSAFPKLMCHTIPVGFF